MLGLRYPIGSDPATTEPMVLPGGLVDTWRDKPVADIDAHDVHAVVSDAVERGIPGLPRRKAGASEARGRKLHAALSVLFRWLWRQRKIASNPCAAVERPGPPPARDRVLSDAELVPFWRTCDALGSPYGPLFQLLLLTGARLSEVAGMRRDELADGDWTIPAERSKNHRPHLLPLPPLAQEVIGRVPLIEGSSYVFPITDGSKPVDSWTRAKHALDAEMARQAGAKVAAFRLHDLRRTCATGMADLDVPPHVVEAALNHVSGSKAGVAGTYNKAAYAKEKRMALLRWSQHVRGLVHGRAAKVLPMRGKGRV